MSPSILHEPEDWRAASARFVDWPVCIVQQPATFPFLDADGSLATPKRYSSLDQMFEFILAVLLVELTPGPNMAYLAALALARGRAAGLFAIIGVALGLSVHAAVASFGAGELLLLYPWLYEILRWIGVTYLLFLAWEGWRTKEKSPGTADLNTAPGPLILRGFLANVFNPKSVLFFVSVVPTFVGISPGQPDFPLQMAIFGIVYVAIATAVHATIVMLAAELRPWLVEGPGQNVVRRVLAVALVFVAGWLFWATKH